ncbi:Glucans biosynthesis glucosyltransferase H [Rubripirellula tenax]|uniref:Glucans biosynthesis glucosyltransferase H n=1 Tax=Rubripirellula tenax TaxID=2528015 RepID=A0A5C6FJC5_9BACT|nr:glucans biosynthesis glucosyltransferase MdoH [Rubripirellula tenax]TWU60197.1 Glucans biosynthesis glucosyltransferase H [Rubripirellula tenax]
MLRSLIIAGTSAITVTASWAYTRIVAGGVGLNVFEVASIILFALLFAWITFSFLVATAGWIRVLRYGASRSISTEIDGRDSSSRSSTAVLMPVYNESPDRVFAGIRAMLRSLDENGDKTTFDFYVLSDTTDHEVWLSEEQAWSRLTADLPDARVFYRHRPENHARKAGNIADFCSRWGSRYSYMIVLDADSLMEGRTMMSMVDRMDADDQIGILQVPPTPVGRESLFARAQQFAAAAYGRVFVEGFAAWTGSDGNYWGHNAIIRVEPFLDHCDLPVLPGVAPLGGEILSHDFVEAALMLRAGWKIELATDLGGSYEECPPTLADYAVRDQRWCQGNLQHARLVISEGFHPLSRFHFSSGVMAYAASPIWIAFTLLCILGMAVERIRSVSQESIPIGGAMVLFALSMTLLLLPKVFALLAITFDSKLRRSFGGVIRLWAGGMAEILISILLSPIMAMFHTRFVLSALRGTSVKWMAQQRDEHGVRWSDAVKQFGLFSAVGTSLAIATWLAIPRMLIWFSPMLIGLVFSIPIAVAMGSRWWGHAFKRIGLLIIPEETTMPRVCEYQIESHRQSSSVSDHKHVSLFETVIRDPQFHLLHTHIQLATGGSVELPINQSKAIEAAYAASGPSGIPVAVRSDLLCDLKTLRSLHLESQR